VCEKILISRSLFHLVLPEGHGEPHSHHHVGGAAVLRGENAQEITPHLKDKRTKYYTHITVGYNVNKVSFYPLEGINAVPESLSKRGVNKPRRKKHTKCSEIA